jgi:hypothetical protein
MDAKITKFHAKFMPADAKFMPAEVDRFFILNMPFPNFFREKSQLDF